MINSVKCLLSCSPAPCLQIYSPLRSLGKWQALQYLSIDFPLLISILSLRSHNINMTRMDSAAESTRFRQILTSHSEKMHNIILPTNESTVLPPADQSEHSVATSRPMRAQHSTRVYCGLNTTFRIVSERDKQAHNIVRGSKIFFIKHLSCSLFESHFKSR